MFLGQARVYPRVEHLSGVQFVGRLLALTTNIGQGRKSSSGETL
jgi:hypothetical protein